MPLYDFRCPDGEVVEAFFAMQQKPDTVTCPHCGRDAVNLIPAIGPSQRNSSNMRIVDAAKATADQPGVVNSIAGRHTTKRQPTAITRNPLHQKLPRP
ncbi:zinc ribbon domain-containing protein [Yaniella flava]|uniref:Zinc ribbon domain-containing protein n=1 Tax=Yaniella flava TaxID=287930 RepID=A0ABP5G213_9MICC|nr:zinc ribbon domain-containing protein [Micrococcaceae bacterium]